ncbi:Long chain base biosynthesis protein 1a [Porphyridium purpureum]|uniref:serine C-palmitoyltransferase n=1 Tax=Porphyridium purpureum TaxID=35688 RepID=A0A5J4Z4N3_PORPP|nr:Long chain base biosynthesis protein 1a [Porphyridium purpureum]|eukprot:POR7718..scf295_1
MPLTFVLESATVQRWLSLGIHFHVIEALALVMTVYFLIQRSYKLQSKKRKSSSGQQQLQQRHTRGRGDAQTLSEQEKAALIASWRPAPLADAPRKAEMDLLEANRSAVLQLSSAAMPRCDVDNHKNVLNLAATNFANVLGDVRVEDACVRTMQQFGLGSCGPRGFYGTTTEHMRCEEVFAKWTGAPECISYSFGSSVPSSVIPAFCKRDDLVVCEEGCNFSIQNGVTLSRSIVKYFKAGDYDELEQIIQHVVARDKPRARMTQRRFVVVEAINSTYGTIARLDKLVEFRNKYKFRIMLDESYSLGALGASGRGLVEHFGLQRADVDITMADAGNALCSVGGFCCGEPTVVRHQRLSGAGYCFSAAQPPFLATACVEAIHILEQEGKARTDKLRRNVQVFRKALCGEFFTAGAVKISDAWKVDGDVLSPLIFIRPAEETSCENAAALAQQQRRLLNIRDALLPRGVMVAVPHQAELYNGSLSIPGLRIAISAGHEAEDLEFAAAEVRAVLSLHESER